MPLEHDEVRSLVAQDLGKGGVGSGQHALGDADQAASRVGQAESAAHAPADLNFDRALESGTVPRPPPSREQCATLIAKLLLTPSRCPLHIERLPERCAF